MSARDELLAALGYRDWPVGDRAAHVAILDAYRAEVLADNAPPCAVCETPIEWVDCPTGGWWAHRTHPDDGHDAWPPGVPTPAETDAVYADVPEDDQFITRAQASADKLRRLFAGGCMPAAAYQGTRGEPGEGQ